MTFEKVSVLVPTRQRLERLGTLLESFQKTTTGEAELVFRSDDDDPGTHEFLLGHKLVVGPRLAGYRSMPVFFNEMYVASDGDVLMCGNDDMVFRTPGWAKAILDEANRHPDGIFNIGVSTHNALHYPFSTISRRVTDCLGFIWDPEIFWGDIFLRDVMGTLERLVMLPEVEIEHDWAGFKPDKVFAEANQNDIYARDPHYWSGTHAWAVERAVDKLRRIM